jgi:hypothetical protein
MDNQVINYKKYLLLVAIVGAFAHVGLYFLTHSHKEEKSEIVQYVKNTVNMNSKTALKCLEEITLLDVDDTINEYPVGYVGDMQVDVLIDSIKKTIIVNDVKLNSLGSTFTKTKCHFYTTKFKNVTREPKTSYDASLWRYTYTGEGEKILDFTRRIDQYNSFFIYNLGYSIEPNERYIVLSHGFMSGGEDYKDIILYVKDIETLKDVAVVDLKNDVFGKNSDIYGDILFENAHWSKDGKYFLVPFHDQADVTGYIRVNLIDGSYDVYDAYLGTMAGDQININTGWTTFDDGPEWSGWSDIEESNRDEWRAKGIKVNFGIYNIYTKEKRIIEQVDDTTHWHEPRWIDDNTLEYLSITGQKKVYTISSN